jgi:predicted small secreted protein
MRRPLLAAVAAAAVLLSGCSATVAGAPAPIGATGGDTTIAPTNDPQVWMNNVCGSLLPFKDSVASAPRLDQKDATTAARSLTDYLGKTETAIDQALSGLDAVGPAPVADGDRAVSKIKSALTTVRASFDKAKKALDGVDPNDAGQVAATLPTVFASLEDISKIEDPTTDLRSNPTLKAAYAQAPNCQTLAKDN